MQNDSLRPSDAEIVRQVLDGNVNAFESILTRYKVQVLTIVKKHVPNDAVEETIAGGFCEGLRVLADIQRNRRFQSMALFNRSEDLL